MRSRADALAEWCLDRLGEWSTWRGIVGLLTVIGITIDPAKLDVCIGLGLLSISLINIFRREHAAGRFLGKRS